MHDHPTVFIKLPTMTSISRSLLTGKSGGIHFNTYNDRSDQFQNCLYNYMCLTTEVTSVITHSSPTRVTLISPGFTESKSVPYTNAEGIPI